jgi:hypothetical protein
MLIAALPFATPFGGSAKFTNPGAAETVRDVVSTAFRLTIETFEFCWAIVTRGNPAKPASPARSAKRSAARGWRVNFVDSTLNKVVKFGFSALQLKARGMVRSESLLGPYPSAKAGGQNFPWLPAYGWQESGWNPSCLVRWTLGGLCLDYERTGIGACGQRQASGVNRQRDRVGAMGGIGVCSSYGLVENRQAEIAAERCSRIKCR